MNKVGCAFGRCDSHFKELIDFSKEKRGEEGVTNIMMPAKRVGILLRWCSQIGKCGPTAVFPNEKQTQVHI